MKPKAILYSIIGAILTLVSLNIFFAGNKHVAVVEENGTLAETNQQLKSENGSLKTANAKLTAEKDSVVTKLTTVTKKLDVILKVNADVLPAAIVRIEDDVNLEMGWTNPEDAFTRLQDRLNRIPTAEEFEKTLNILVDKNLLFGSSEKDPYIKDKQITKAEIKGIVKQMLAAQKELSK